MKTAIVLSGGGGRGAYQIGVWKALRKLGIHYDIVTGNSVGALNGILMVQHDYQQAFKIWSNIDYNFVFNKEVARVDEAIYVKYIKEFVKEGGMDITNLEKAVELFFDKERFYSSEVDFGIVVYNLSQGKGEFFTKKDLKPEMIRDYVIASATCYPAFKIKKINNKKYIDGGYYDNMPINLAIDLGADKIIAVDLKAPGFKRKIKDKSKDIVHITPNNDIGSFLKFDKDISRRNIKYGYNDTMKVFGKLIGTKYTFYKSLSHLFINRIEIKFDSNIDKYLNNNHNNMLDKIKMLLPKMILNSEKLKGDSTILNTMEFLGDVFKLDDSKIYCLPQYNYLLKRAFKKIPEVNESLIKEKLNKKDFDSLLGSKYIVKYIYQILKATDKYNDVYPLMPIFKKEFLAAIYLISIGG
ncbi:MAG: patatin-like phospholipase family protein [Firmicutes bacterium]|nr:patatin-like phospholipase family protein [Bacillota bacterium]